MAERARKKTLPEPATPFPEAADMLREQNGCL